MKKRLILFIICACILVSALAPCSFATAQDGAVFSERSDTQAVQARGTYPAQEYYNSREQGFVPGTEDQKTTELCWAFVQGDLVESSLLKNGEGAFDMSEQTLKFETSSVTNPEYGHERLPNGAGSEYISIAYLARSGITLERDEVFTLSEKRSVIPERLTRYGVLKNAPVLTFSDSERDAAVKTIKKLVVDYGAVGAGMYYETKPELKKKYENYGKTNYYYYGAESSLNHSVSIIGWDDNYAKENFVSAPQGDGAFIVKNSWGNMHSNDTTDLVYVSYYDKFIWSELFATEFSMDTEGLDNLYQYDYQGYTRKYSYPGDNRLMYATRYKKSSPGESITAVSTFVTEPGTKIEVFVNPDCENVNDDGYIKVHTQTFEYAGYYLMEFEPVRIVSDNFFVAIQVSSAGGDASYPVCENAHGALVYNATQRSETCFITSGGLGSFYAVEKQISHKTSKSMLVMKAYTKNVPFEMIDSASVFADIKSGDWFKNYVDFAVTYDLFNGTSKTLFSPQSAMTRAQFVQVLANISGADVADSAVKTSFYDVPSGKWFTAAVKWASDNGIVSGTGYREFAPDRKITREEMCVMLINYCEKYLGLEMPQSTYKFTDDGSISTWAKTAVYKCRYAQIISGKSAGIFAPSDTATRAEGATVFTQFYKNYILM